MPAPIHPKYRGRPARTATINNAIMQTSLENVAKDGEMVAPDRGERMQRVRMLVMEDPLCVQKTIDAITDAMGMNVDLAENDRIVCLLATLSLAEGKPYDVILIDCQPSLGLLTVNALVAAHGVVIPLACEFFAMRGVALLVDTVGKVQDRLNPSLTLDAIVPTMYDARTLHAQEVVTRVREAFGDRVTETMIGRTIKFPDATVAAEPILTFAPTHAGSEQYRQLARELVARGVSA